MILCTQSGKTNKKKIENNNRIEVMLEYLIIRIFESTNGSKIHHWGGGISIKNVSIKL